MTNRFGNFEEGEMPSILNPAGPEPERPSAPARAVASVRHALAEGKRKEPVLAGFVTGAIFGAVVALLGGLIR